MDSFKDELLSFRLLQNPWPRRQISKRQSGATLHKKINHFPLVENSKSGNIYILLIAHEGIKGEEAEVTVEGST